MRIDHLGIVVKDFEAAEVYYRNLFPECTFKKYKQDEEGNDILFVIGDNIKLEIIAPFKEENNIQKFLDKRGEGIHHIAYETPDIQETMKNVKDMGKALTTEEPYPGIEGHDVIFVDLKDTNGVLTEFFQI